MNANATAKIVSLLKALIAIEDACGCCDQNFGHECCVAYEKVLTVLDDECDLTEEEFEALNQEIFGDIQKWIDTHEVADDQSDDEESDPTNDDV